MPFQKGNKLATGRPKGSRNKATRELQDLAKEYVPDAIIELARLANSAVSEQARVAAIKEIFDRAHGKAAQATDLRVSNGEGNGGVFKIEFVGPVASKVLKSEK